MVESPSPPNAPERQARRTSWPMWLLGLVIMIDQIDQNIVRGVVTPLKDDPHLHMTDFKIGLLLSCFVVVNGLITVPAGYLADRWHRTRTIGTTIVGWSGLTALTAAMPNFGGLLAVRRIDAVEDTTTNGTSTTREPLPDSR